MYLGRRVTIHINAARGESVGSSQNGFSCWSSWPTYPPFSSPLLKPVCGQPSEGACTRRSHWGRQLDGSSCLDALALLPYSMATPQSVLPFYSILRLRFRWRLTATSDVFMLNSPSLPLQGGTYLHDEQS